MTLQDLKVVVTQSNSDEMKIEIHIPSTPAHKNRWKKDPNTKKRPAKDNSTAAKKPRHRESKENYNVKWKCGICKDRFSTVKLLRVHVNRAHAKEIRNKKARKITKWPCVICNKYYSCKGSLKTHLIKLHSTKKNDKISDHKGTVPALRKKRVVTVTPKVPAKKFTKYECSTCGKTEDTYDASVRHAQEHLVQLEALIRENGPQSELRFDHHNRDDNNDGSLIQTKFDYKTLLNDSWINMFKRTKWSKTILESSLYKYTRLVKLTWDTEKKEVGEGHCVPLYKCSACGLCVEPAKVEIHCENYQACVVCVPQAHKCSDCQRYFHTHNALMLHKKDHEDYKNLRFRIVTFNNENDVQFNMALREMSPLSVGNTQSEKQEKISGRPETPKRNVSEKNDVHNNVSKYCDLCKRSHSVSEDHKAYHDDKSKKIMETIAKKQQSCSAETAKAKKQNNGNTEQEAEAEENMSLVMEWNSDDDSGDEEQQSFNTYNLKALQQFREILTKNDEIKQKTNDDCKKLQGNPKNDDDEVKVTAQPDQFDECEFIMEQIFGAENNEDTVESDQDIQSQSTEDLQRVLEGDSESDLDDEE